MTPQDLKQAFERGENITSLLRGEEASPENTEEIIETAYDLQTGSYVEALNDPVLLKHKEDYGSEIARVISGLTDASSIVEAGVGEGTTLSFVIDQLNGSGESAPLDIHGFDISWSRVAKCNQWLKRKGVTDAEIAVASILATPYCDNAFDVVYTSHSIEPNGGKEDIILQELFRITSRYLILLEPGYELTGQEAQERMERLGYCKNLVGVAKSLGMVVVKNELFPHCANPLNPTAITIIAKNPSASSATPSLVCPNYRTPLDRHVDCFYSPDSLRAYPLIKGVPCLRPSDAVIASKFLETD